MYFLANLTNPHNPTISHFFYQTSDHCLQMLRDIQWSFELPNRAVLHRLYRTNAPNLNIVKNDIYF